MKKERLSCKSCAYFDFADKTSSAGYAHPYDSTWNHACLARNANHFSCDSVCKKYIARTERNLRMVGTDIVRFYKQLNVKLPAEQIIQDKRLCTIYDFCRGLSWEDLTEDLCLNSDKYYVSECLFGVDKYDNPTYRIKLKMHKKYSIQLPPYSHNDTKYIYVLKCACCDNIVFQTGKSTAYPLCVYCKQHTNKPTFTATQTFYSITKSVPEN